MKIKTQLIITMLLFGIILVVITVSAIIVNQSTEKASEQEKIAGSIAEGANELSYLANDYLVYRESQQFKRWQSRLASFSNQVASLNVDKPEQQVLVRNIQAGTQRLKDVFDSVASTVRLSAQDQRAALDLSFLQVSWSRMAVQSQGLVSDASRLSQLLDQHVGQLREIRTVLIYLMVILFGLFLLASYMLTYRRILKSLLALEAGAAVIGSGNLDFKIEEKQNDEIGDLSHAFNRMAANLKDVTASKSELEREIAERKRAEEELRRQREWLQVTLSSIGDAVIATDTEGQITFLNPVAVTLTGRQPEETLGQSIQSVFRIINEKTHAPADDLVARVLAEKRVVALANDTALVAKDGDEIPIEDSAAPILDATGNVTGVVLVFHDVTAKRRAQDALREAHDRAAWLARFPEQNPNPVIRASSDGTVLYCNPASAKSPGWKCGVGQPLQNELLPLIRRAMAEGKELQWDVEIEGKVYFIWIAPVAEERYANIYARDITERKRAEETLAKTKNILSEGEKIAHLGTFEYIADTETTVWSEEEYRIYGLDPAGQSPAYDVMLAKSIHPDDAALLHQAFTAAMQSTSVYELEHRIVRPDGSVRWVYDRAHPYFDQSGKLVRYVGATLDITERKRAEEALLQSERRERERAEELAAVFDATPIPIFLAHDIDCHHIVGNRAADDLLRNPRGGEASLDAPAEIKPQHFRAFKDGRELSNNELPAQRAARGFPVHDFEFSLVFDDGTVRHVVGYGTPLGDQAGRPRGCVLVLADITERKRMEEDLRQAEEKSRLLIKYAPSMFYEIDFHGPRFKSVNDHMCEFLGYTREELLAMNPFDLLDDEGKALFRERIRRKFAGENINDSVEYKSRTKDGREVYGVLNISFTYKDGKPEGAIVVAHDITERKRAEEGLKQRASELHDLAVTLEQRVHERTEELEEANKALRQLSIRLLSAQEEERKRVASELHDTIGSCLSGIKFKVESALEEIAKTPKAATESLSTIVPVIQEAVEECRRIQLDLRPSMLDDLGLLPTLSWFFRRFQTIYSTIHIEQEMKIKESELPNSLKIVIYRIIQEAMNNAAKHSKADVVRISLRKVHNKMELFVADNGCGFSFQQRLFLNDSRRGFGLTSMRERTELSGGSFAVESAEGKGTTIRASWSI